MLNKLLAFLRQHSMVEPGEHIICAVSGGADSVALLFAMYLLREKLAIRLSAAHFNHHLRGAESDRDESFVREFCARYNIPLYVGEGTVIRGEKGLEAAARDARYAYLRGLDGKIATAHTADDNAETVLLHLVRGTGLKGLGGIAPVNGTVIRPMLSCTRQDVEAFLSEWGLHCVQDSSNATDTFLRNRLRHHVMPLLRQENPRLAENVSAMALRLRQDEACLAEISRPEYPLDVDALRQLPPSLRSRVLEAFLKDSGVREPEAVHIARVEALVFSKKPSARANLPGEITVARNYSILEAAQEAQKLPSRILVCPGETLWGEYRIVCCPAEEIINTPEIFTVVPEGTILLRPREPGDAIRLPGGTKSLKKLFIDKKIPAKLRERIPVIADSSGVLAVCGIGANIDRRAQTLPGVQIRIEKMTNTEGK